MSSSLPQSWSRQEICEAYGISPEEIRRLIKAGQIGYIRSGRSKRFLAEHIAQIQSAIEVKPRAPTGDVLTQIGVTPRSAARRRSA